MPEYVQMLVAAGWVTEPVIKHIEILCKSKVFPLADIYPDASCYGVRIEHPKGASIFYRAGYDTWMSTSSHAELFAKYQCQMRWSKRKQFI
jgi:hypothetical protein